MSINKKAQIRYSVLDKCFSNFQRIYTYQDLLGEVNSILIENGAEPIQLRQLQYDIKFMESDAGFGIELDENLKIGKKRVFRYSNKDFSISDHPLNQSDSDQLETTIQILSRYKHRQEFKWIEEFIPRMEMAFDLVSGVDDDIIGYEENPDLEGRQHLGHLFNLILKKKVVKLEYQPYKKEKESFLIHPYYLKQYNSRWFLFCYNEEFEAISNYPLDRIVSCKETGEKYIPSSINWFDYFEDIVGVTKPEGVKPLDIKLRFSLDRIKYILTKPLHGSQKLDRKDKENRTVVINVIPNFELYQMLLSFGSDLVVAEPELVRNKMKDYASKLNLKYK
ncbi:helix-turn-helix transcriptional regulator [Christiangramia aquimixticola]|uniref:helix-turn-helix transcriptional regulator n=1 Tax=Christiangramia aquimixticola TaxID=1697558 RepID=UPI003AA9D364